MSLPPNGSQQPTPPPSHLQHQEGASGRRPKVCGACGDRAKSFHFGGISCDSCKAFFRRSVQNEAFRNFHCPYEGKCEITITSRKCCQYCRFHKCLSIGMETGWVMTEEERLQLVKNRMERKQRQGTLEPSQPQESGKKPYRTTSFSDYEPDVNDLPKHLSPDDINTIETLVNAYEISYHEVPFSENLQSPSSSSTGRFSENLQSPSSSSTGRFGENLQSPSSSYTGRFSENLQSPSSSSTGRFSENLQSPSCSSTGRFGENLQSPSSSSTGRFSENLHSPSCSSTGRTRTEILDMFFTAVKQFTNFSQRLDSFRILQQHDQEILLRTGVLELCFVRGAYVYDEKLARWPHTGKPLYRDSPILDAEDIKKLVSSDLFEKHIEFIRSVKDLNPDEATTMLLLVIILLSPDRPGLKNELLVAQEQEKFYILLKKYMSWRYGSENTVILYPKLLLRLPDLRELNDYHTDYNLRLGSDEIQQIQQKLSSLKIDSCFQKPEPTASTSRTTLGSGLTSDVVSRVPWSLKRDVLRAPSSPFSQEEESSSSESSDRMFSYRS